MAWERVKPVIVELSDPPSLSGWLLAGVLTLIVGILLFVLHASEVLKPLSSLNIWWLSLSPSGVWLFLFCLRGWLWDREVAEHQFQKNEAEYGQQQWESWAERHLGILGSCVLLPNGINADNILLADNNLPTQNALTCRIFDNLPDIADLMRQCLAGVQEALTALPSELPLKITLLTDRTERSDLLSGLDSAWKRLFPCRGVPCDIAVTDSLLMSWVEQRITQPVLTVDLILVLQLNGHDSYSDGLAALLLTSDDVVQKYQLPHMARLLRPMSLDMTHFADEFRLFLETQTVATRTDRIVCDDSVWREILPEVLTIGAKQKALWGSGDTVMLERWAGVPGPAATWILTALAAEIADRKGDSLLMLHAATTGHYVSSVIPGSENG